MRNPLPILFIGLFTLLTSHSVHPQWVQQTLAIEKNDLEYSFANGLQQQDAAINTIDTSLFRYYPLQIGNSWTYHFYSYYTYGGQYSYDYRVTIIDTIILDSHKYFVMYSMRSEFNRLIRIDSSNGNILIHSGSPCPWSSYEVIIDSLNARLNDSVNQNCRRGKCFDTSTVSIFGQNAKSKSLFSGALVLSWGYTHKYSFGFGPHYVDQLEIQPHVVNEETSTLKGCKINGITYGDTILTSVVENNMEIPEFFSFSQNYPNPFNPVTIVKFDLPKDTKVNLSIYDLLGRLVKTLVNEYRKTGYYEEKFDGTNMASGVYFYRIEAGNFIDSKKMVLIK